jgi:putative membrane protein
LRYFITLQEWDKGEYNQGDDDMNILIQWLINALAVYATAHLLDGIHIKSFGAAVLVALVLGLVNAIVRPVLVFLSIPFIIVTLGLFLLVINALLLQLSASIVGGFSIDSFWWAVAGSLVISLISWLLSALFNL